MTTDDRVPPCDQQAERALLGRILMHGVPELHAALDAGVAENWFYMPNHMDAWRALVNLDQRGAPIDCRTIIAEMGGCVTVEGLALCSWMDEGTMGNVPFWCEILRLFLLRRQAIKQGVKLMAVGYATEARTPEEFVAELPSGIDGVSATNRRTTFDGQTLSGAALEEAERITEQRERPDAIKTGLVGIDTIMPIEPGSVVVIAGRPGNGKSAIALNIALHNASRGIPCAFFSLEMTGQKLAMRAACSLSRVNSAALRNGGWPNGDKARYEAGAATISTMPLIVDECSGIRIGSLCARIGHMVRKHGVRVVVVDYLQLVFANRNHESREREVAEVSAALKSVALRHGIAVVVTAQLNRKAEDYRPRKADLRESGAIEQDADAIILLHVGRPPVDPDHVPTVAIISKNREGTEGDVALTFHRSWSLFEG